MRKSWLAAAAALFAVTPAFAADLTSTSEGYTYFNRPGATLAMHDEDVRACREMAAQLHQPQTQSTVVTSGGIYAVIGAAIADAIIAAVKDHKAHPINVENCMVVKGWRVVALSPDEGKQLDELKIPDLNVKLQDWVGASDPHGTIVRQFANDAALTPMKMFDVAKNPSKAALSVKLLGDEPQEDPKAKAKPKVEKTSLPTMKSSARPPKPLKQDKMGSIPADSALVIVNIKGVGSSDVQFERIGPDPKTPAWVDGRPASFTVEQPKKAFAKSGTVEGATVAFAVPPGRWRISSVTGGLFQVSFCMGSPAFDVAAGDVIYAGSFDPDDTSTGFRPDMALEPAKAAFPAFSDMAVKVQPAAYVNGTTGDCVGAYGYALELPDRPFVDGYKLGSLAPGHAVAAPAVAAATTTTAAQSVNAPPAPAPAPAPPVATFQPTPSSS